MIPMFETSVPADGLAFPQSLADKYRPKKLSQFVGVHKPRKVMEAFAGKPFPSAWYFLGPSGLGKTSMALALVEELGGELHHIPSQSCNVETIEQVIQMCHYVPRGGLKSFHVVLVDEADRMSPAGQLKFLSKLDATAFPPQTIFVFTANDTSLLEKRFLSRCRMLQFEAESVEADLIDFLQRIYKAEGGTFPVDFQAIVRDTEGNVRDALGRLEVELLMGADRSDMPAKVSRMAETLPEENELSPIAERPDRVPRGRRKRNSEPCGLPKGQRVELAPFIRRALRIRAQYKGRMIQGQIRKDGRIEVEGKVFNSPSAAAGHITPGASGWQFWKFEKGGVFHPIDRLRKEAVA